MSEKEKPKLLIQEVLSGLGRLNALVKNLMVQTGASDPNEAIRRVNSGEWIVVRHNKDKSKFDPVAFLGEGWYINPSDIQLLAAQAGTCFDEIEFVHMLCDHEDSVVVEERIRRHQKAGNKCLTADHFLHFWNLRDRLPRDFRRTENGKRRKIVFDGTILRDPNDVPHVLSLYWINDTCHHGVEPFGDLYGRTTQSAIARE